jgi:hypothetical protein
VLRGAMTLTHAGIMASAAVFHSDFVQIVMRLPGCTQVIITGERNVSFGHVPTTPQTLHDAMVPAFPLVQGRHLVQQLQVLSYSIYMKEASPCLQLSGKSQMPNQDFFSDPVSFTASSSAGVWLSDTTVSTADKVTSSFGNSFW